MGFKMPSVVFMAAVACAGVALVLQTVGVATTGWLVNDHLEMGPWKVCAKATGECFDFKARLQELGASTDWVDAVRGLGIVSILLLGGCLLVSAAACFLDNANIPLLAAALAFVGGVCNLSEFAIFAAKTQDTVKEKEGPNFGYSFALTIVAWLLAMLAGGIFIFSKLRGNRMNP